MAKLRFEPRYTVEDYEQWEGDWELWDGTAVAMSPSPTRLHQTIARNFILQFQQQLIDSDACHCQTLHEIDWRIDTSTVVRPDVVVVCDQSDTPFIESPPSLIVEVLSESTAGKDRLAKRQLYSDQGVGYYLLADPASKNLEVLRLDGNSYRETRLPLELHDGCGLTLETASLWS